MSSLSELFVIQTVKVNTERIDSRIQKKAQFKNAFSLLDNCYRIYRRQFLWEETKGEHELFVPETEKKQKTITTIISLVRTPSSFDRNFFHSLSLSLSLQTNEN